MAESAVQSYAANKTVIRDIIQVDHFSNAVPASIIDLWLEALNPTSEIALPPDVRGFYGGDLRASIPIELAHDCYKHIMHETEDKAKLRKYAGRMLIVLSLLDLDVLAQRDANLVGLALWHKALAQVRMPSSVVADLADTLGRYETLRPLASLSDAKLPSFARLKLRLLAAAQALGHVDKIAYLTT